MGLLSYGRAWPYNGSSSTGQDRLCVCVRVHVRAHVCDLISETTRFHYADEFLMERTRCERSEL